MRHTVEYVLLAVSLELVLGIFVAVTLHRVFRGRGIVLAILILPWALPSVVSGVLWRRVFDPDNGLLNSVLLQLHVISQPHVWLASGRGAIVYITLVHVWGVLPLVSLIFLAGLQSIPEEVYSASAVDGAGAVAAVSLHHAAAAAAVDRDRAHGRDAACDRDLRRDLRPERHRPEHALDPDPGLQHDVRRRPTSRTGRRSRSCSPRHRDARRRLRARSCGGRPYDDDTGRARAEGDRRAPDRRLVGRADRARRADEHLDPARRGVGADALAARTIATTQAYHELLQGTNSRAAGGTVTEAGTFSRSVGTARSSRSSRRPSRWSSRRWRPTRSAGCGSGSAARSWRSLSGR